MKLNKLSLIALFAGLILASGNAAAFTFDNSTGINPDGSPRFVDPDDQPSPFGFMGSEEGKSGFSFGDSASGNAAPSAVGEQNPGVYSPKLYYPGR